ncbi:MAG TPA: penicillin-binding transpeptidase domain-containing protein [Bryobacteraceae bacterium]|nr:penicillin-binding transpeptidase domain-containing protein [Bryobacteraceae bacterium]
MDSNEQPGRRQVLAAIAGAAACAVECSGAESPGAAAVLMKVGNRRVLACDGSEAAKRWLGAPGSTIKPLSLLALLDAGKVSQGEEFECPGQLTLAGRSLNCSHPKVPVPMNVSRAIAYSCNCAVAHFAQRFAPGEFEQALLRDGLASPTGLLAGLEAAGSVRAESGAEQQLQALGERGVTVTPLELLAAYRRMARRIADPKMWPVVEGMEGAVEFGTAQRARLQRVRVAGKTGTVRMASGFRAAWFAGFAPSRAPEVALVVLVQGRSGGSDAAPVAGTLLREYFGVRA